MQRKRKLQGYADTLHAYCVGTKAPTRRQASFATIYCNAFNIDKKKNRSDSQTKATMNTRTSSKMSTVQLGEHAVLPENHKDPRTSLILDRLENCESDISDTSVISSSEQSDDFEYDAFRLLEQREKRRRATRVLTKKGVSGFVAYCMIMNVYVGFGIVSIPYSIAAGGWLSLLLIPVMALLAWSTSLQITKSFIVTGANTYEDLGRAAAGPFGEFWVLITLLLLIVIVCAYVALLSANVINEIAAAAGIDESQWSIFYGFIVYTFALVALVIGRAFQPSLDTLGSKLGTATVVILLFSLIGLSISTIPNRETCENEVPVIGSSIAGTIAGIMLNFGGHAFLPTVWREMEDPEKNFKRVSGAAFASLAVIYSLIGMVGYAALGPSALNQKDGNALLSLLDAMPDSATQIALSILSMFLVLKILLLVPPFFDVAVGMVAEKVFPGYREDSGCESWENGKSNRKKRLVVESFYSAGTSCYFCIWVWG